MRALTYLLRIQLLIEYLQRCLKMLVSMFFKIFFYFKLIENKNIFNINT